MCSLCGSARPGPVLGTGGRCRRRRRAGGCAARRRKPPQRMTPSARAAARSGSTANPDLRLRRRVPDRRRAKSCRAWPKSGTCCSAAGSPIPDPLAGHETGDHPGSRPHRLPRKRKNDASESRTDIVDRVRRRYGGRRERVRRRGARPDVHPEQSEETLVLKSGCICCSIRTDLVSTLMQLAALSDARERRSSAS